MIIIDLESKKFTIKKNNCTIVPAPDPCVERASLLSERASFEIYDTE